jgi:hypothetical protein
MDKKYVTRNGEYDAKVVYIHDSGECPVAVVLTDKKRGTAQTVMTRLNGQMYRICEDGFDLIKVPEATQDGWVEFDVENDEVPYLHMHDMIEVRYDNEYVSTPVPAWSVDFDSSRYPVVAYRVIKKADASEIEKETIDE